MNGKYHFDLEKLNKSLETISGVEDCVSSRDLSEGFTNLENYFRDINFEHGNCLKYKEDLELIYSNIGQIKRKISNLADSLITTIENYSDIESLNSKDIKELSSIYRNTPSSENLKKLVDERTSFKRALAADLNQQQAEQLDEYTTTTINTVPIGIAIGAAGIAGSIGTVIVNEKYGKKRKNKELEEMDDDELFASSKIEKSSKIVNSKADTFDSYNAPYKASREQREVDKYYGNDFSIKDEYEFDENDSDEENYLE